MTESTVKVANALAESTSLSRGRVKLAMSRGAVWLAGPGKPRRIRRATTMAKAGDQISLYYDSDILDAAPPLPEQIGDGPGYSVWFKPSGLMSSGSRWGDHFGIDRVLEGMLNQPVFLVHRLDRFAQGLMVVAHKRKTAAALAAQFESRSTLKIYKAIVEGVLEKKLTMTSAIDGRSAVTHIEPIAADQGRTLVQVHIETGRKHQIRKHLAEAGFALVGDRQYGDSTYPALQLVAVKLGFQCPASNEVREFTLPADRHPALDQLDQTSLD